MEKTELVFRKSTKAPAYYEIQQDNGWWIFVTFDELLKAIEANKN